MAWAKGLGAWLLVLGSGSPACVQTTTAGSEPQPAPQSVQPAPAAPQGPQQELPLGIRVSGSSVEIGGKPSSDDEGDLRRMVDKSPGSKRSARVTLATGSENLTVARVLSVLDDAGIDDIELVLGAENARLKLETERGFMVPVTLGGPKGPGGLWFLKPDAAPVAWTPGESTSDAAIESALAERCKSQCRVGVWARPGTSVEQLFAALRVIAHWQERLAGLELRMLVGPPPGLPRDKAGTMPPELIQAIIRARFGAFRMCYEQGLARDAGLTGLVKAKFVIDREGKVSSVADEGSNIADDAVRECVLKAFSGLIFPAPEGGIVTVVYPINLAPG